jgi:hypothetical protein
MPLADTRLPEATRNVNRTNARITRGTHTLLQRLSQRVGGLSTDAMIHALAAEKLAELEAQDSTRAAA